MNLSTDIKFSNNLIENRTCTITYSGALFKNNSDVVTIVYGFDDGWENTTEQKMSKTENGFTAKIKLLDFENLNFCFKNSNNEWDNNSNFNYTSPISKILEENFIINEDILDNILDNIFSCDLSEMTRESFTQNTIQENIIETVTQEPILENAIESVSSDVINETIQSKSITDVIDEIISEPIKSEIIDKKLFENIEDDVLDEDFSVNFTQNSNFDMDSLVEDILSPITQASVLSESTLNNEETLNTEIDEIANEIIESSESNIVEKENTFNTEINNEKESNISLNMEQNALEEDKQIDGLIDNLITNLYNKATFKEEISKMNIDDTTISSIINTIPEVSTDIPNNNFTSDIIDNTIPENILSENVTDTSLYTMIEDITNIPNIQKNTNTVEPTNTKIENTKKVETSTPDVEESLFNNTLLNDIPKIKQNSETSLVKTSDNFIVSSKSLSKFYMMRKKIKLAFCKIMALPKFIFGNTED